MIKVLLLTISIVVILVCVYILMTPKKVIWDEDRVEEVKTKVSNILTKIL